MRPRRFHCGNTEDQSPRRHRTGYRPKRRNLPLFPASCSTFDFATIISLPDETSRGIIKKVRHKVEE